LYRELGLESSNSAEFEITLEDELNCLRLCFVDDQLPIAGIVAYSGIASHPHAPTL
jgi:hypothetical protein